MSIKDILKKGASSSIDDKSSFQPRDVHDFGNVEKKILIIGGGVAGMSAAHELGERGFNVKVLEQRSIPGGKARSMGVPGSGVNGKKDLPGEHGFRFFPGFYRHITDTMKRIPYKTNENGVFDNLVQAKHIHLAREGKKDIFIPYKILGQMESRDFMKFLELILGRRVKLSPKEVAFFTSKCVEWLKACDERRLDQYESMSWWDFIEAERFSEEYQKLLAIGITRNLVACKPHIASVRTIFSILMQLLLAPLKDTNPDRLLNGPTSDVWINPWLNYLETLEVDYCLNTKVEQIHVENGLISGVEVSSDGETFLEKADYYILAVPLDRAKNLINRDIRAVQPSLAKIDNLQVDWMNGLQIYLNKRIPFVDGHTNYVDSPWAVTSVMQQEYWPDFPVDQYGDGTVKSIFSIDISNWFVPGVLYGKPAIQCNAEEIFNEVWEQIKLHTNDDQETIFSDEDVVTYFIDPSIQFTENGVVNDEPMFINTTGSWENRPSNSTDLSNLFIASDYVKVISDLATMEGANEAARRCVNDIIDACKSDAPKCEIWELKELDIFKVPRKLDEVSYKVKGYIGEFRNSEQDSGNSSALS